MVVSRTETQSLVDRGRLIACMLVVWFGTSGAIGADAVAGIVPFVASFAPESGSGELPLDQLEFGSRFRPRLSFFHQAGESVGLSKSLTSLRAFVPFSGPGSDLLIFADLGGQFVGDGVLGGSVGLGTRFVSDNRFVVGSYLYYDFRDTGANGFQQLAPGIEFLGADWEARANVYLPWVFSDRQMTPNQFRGNFLFTDRFETALSGFDVEYGASIALLDDFRPWAFAGLYHFQGPGREHLWGAKGRLEASLSDAVSLNLAVQNDRLFDTTVSFGVEVRFSGGSLLKKRPWAAIKTNLLRPARSRSPERRLAAGTRRFGQIVLDQSEETLVFDPATGQPLMILHVASGGNSTGAFEDPYATLNDALSDPRYLNGEVNTVYVRRGASQLVTSTGPLSLLSGARILGNGPVQTVMTQMGERVLPFSGRDVNLNLLPIIQGDVTMADNSTLSGFEIRPTGDGIAATNVSGFTIAGNVVRDAPGRGILLSQISGTGIVSGNKIDDAGQSGLRLEFSSMFNGDLIGNEISDSSQHGIEITDTTFTGTINGNRLVSNDSEGLNMNRSVFSGAISGNTIDQNEQAGIEIRSTQFSGEITDNTIAGTFQGSFTPAELSRIFVVDSTGGFTLDIDPNSMGKTGIFLFGSAMDAGARVADNRISNFEFAGLEIQSPDLDETLPSSFFRGEISGNQISGTIFGMNISNIDPAVTTGGDILNNVVSSSIFGINIGFFNDASTFTGDISGNILNDLERVGIDIRSDNFVGDIANNEVNRSGFTGIDVNLGLFKTGTFTMTGDIAENTITGTESVTITLSDGSPFEIGGDAISFFSTDFVGDVRDNIVTDNKGIGLAVTALTAFTGDFRDNRAERNGLRSQGERGIAFAGGTLTGQITNNLASFNNSTGMQINFTTFNGAIADNSANNNQGFGIASDLVGMIDVLRNTTNNNQFSGLRLDARSTNTGTIADNTSDNNMDAGIRVFLLPFTSAVLLSGNVTGNKARNNSSNGIELTPFTSGEMRIAGDFTGNESSGNGQHGLIFGSTFTGLTRLTGTLSGNTLSQNAQEGLEIRINSTVSDGSDDSTISVLNNTLTDGMSGSGRVVFIENSGAGDLMLTLDGNTASPSLADLINPPFNFDLVNPGSGGFTVGPADVQTGNIGSVGSSGSGTANVPIP